MVPPLLFFLFVPASDAHIEIHTCTFIRTGKRGLPASSLKTEVLSSDLCNLDFKVRQLYVSSTPFSFSPRSRDYGDSLHQSYKNF